MPKTQEVQETQELVDPSAWVSERSTPINKRVSPQQKVFKGPEQSSAERDVVRAELVTPRNTQVLVEKPDEDDLQAQKDAKIERHHNSKFTPEVKDAIIVAVRAGLQPHHAASKAGISRTTYRNWVKKAEDDITSEYGEFLVAVEQAESQHLAELLDEWRVIGVQTKQWTALATLGERRYSDDLAKKPRSAPAQAPTTNIQVNVGQLEQNLHQIHGKRATDLDIYDGG